MLANKIGVAATLTAAATIAMAAPAQAANGTVGQREVVCADSLAMRTEPLGAWMGVLHSV